MIAVYPKIPETHWKTYVVIQNTYCYDKGLNSQSLDPSEEILSMQEWLDPAARYDVEQNPKLWVLQHMLWWCKEL